MNPNLFGYDAWNFFHAIPWKFENEILLNSDLASFVIMVLFTIKLLPCKTCCGDAQMLLKKMDWTNNLFVHKNYKIATRGSVARFVFRFHWKVSDKLKKPVWSDDWKNSVFVRDDWLQSYIRLITIIAWNFPNPEDWKKTHDKTKEISGQYMYDKEQVIFLYRYYFECVVPMVFKNTTLASSYDSFLTQNPLSFLQLANRTNFTRWFSKFRSILSKDVSWNDCLWDFQELNTFFPTFRAKEECGKVDRPSTIFQGCQ